MKLGLIITMYDEFDIVLETITNVKKCYQESTIIVVQSKTNESPESLEKIKILATKFIELPNLGLIFNRFELPAQAICRNFSRGFSELYKLNIDLDVIVGLTGDTLIIDPLNINRRYLEMSKDSTLAMVSQAIGHNFHSDNADPTSGNHGGRYQNDEICDFACCYFILDGKIAINTLAFSKIMITNKWTSEQCLGDELIRVINGKEFFKKVVKRLNSKDPTDAYGYNDGIMYHAKTNGIPSR